MVSASPLQLLSLFCHCLPFENFQKKQKNNADLKRNWSSAAYFGYQLLPEVFHCGDRVTPRFSTSGASSPHAWLLLSRPRLGQHLFPASLPDARLTPTSSSALAAQLAPLIFVSRPPRQLLKKYILPAFPLFYFFAQPRVCLPHQLCPLKLPLRPSA